MAPPRFVSFASAVLLALCAVPLRAQIIAPTIHTVSVDDGDNLRPGSPVTIRFVATAGSLPLQAVTITYRNTNGFGRSFRTETPATGVITDVVTDDWANGEYRLLSVVLENGLGLSTFAASGFVSGPGTPATPGPAETLFLTRMVVSGSTGHVRPVLTGISRSGGADVTGGTSLIFRPAITPGSAAIRSVSVTLRDPNGRMFTYRSETAPFEVSVPVTADWLNGRYTLDSVGIVDAAQLGTWFYRGGQINAIPGPVEHQVAFAPIDFNVTGAVAGVVFPTLNSFTFRTPTARVGESIEIDYSITPGSRPLRSVVFTLRGPASSRRVVATGSAASGTARLAVTAEWVNGTYTLDRVDIEDAGEYLVGYQSNRLVGYSPSARPVGSHNLVFNDYRVVVSGGLVPLPVIVTQPRDASIEPGRGVELSVGATSPDLSGWRIEWFEGSAGDTSRLIRSGSSVLFVQPASVTGYWVRVSNVHGSVDSRVAIVTPRFTSDFPVVLTQPVTPVTTTVGNYALLQAQVVGPGPLVYAWHKDGLPIPGANGPALELGILTPAMSGTYHLVVTNPNGQVETNPVQIVTRDRPRILTQPQSRTVRAGERVTFDVMATGGSLSYSWGKNHSTFGGSPNGSTFTIDRVRREDAGNYTVYITNDMGSVLSETFTLSVIDPGGPLPVVVQPASTVYAIVGQPFGFILHILNDPDRVTLLSALPPGVTWNAESRHILGPVQQAGTFSFTFRIENTAGATTHTVNAQIFAQPFAPIFTRQPESQTVHADEHVTLRAELAYSTGVYNNLTLQWQRDGVPIPGARGDSLEIYYVRPGDAGVYTLEATDYYGKNVSQPARLTVLPAVSAPVITVQPQSQRVPPGSNVTLTVGASSGAAMTYQWLRNGIAVPGATAATLTLTNVEAPQSGAYTVAIKNRAGSTTSATATLALDEIARGHLTNLSVRSWTAGGERTLIAGFAVAGAAKPVLVRVTGPTLEQFGLPNALRDPKLFLHSGARVLEVNDNWNSRMDASGVSLTAARLGAFAFKHQADAATTVTLAPASYTVLAGSAEAGSGITLIEVYDADDAFGRVSGRLVNLSARSQVRPGADVLIAGFVVAGQTPCNVLVRGIGPGLVDFGLPATSVLAAPRLQLYRGTEVVGQNDDWNFQASEVIAASEATGAFPLRTANRDAAFVASLVPGAYTVILSGAGATSGIGLIELYEVP